MKRWRPSPVCAQIPNYLSVLGLSRVCVCVGMQAAIVAPITLEGWLEPMVISTKLDVMLMCTGQVSDHMSQGSTEG